MADQFDNVVHVAPSTIADTLCEFGAEKVVAFPDLLTHGPVSSKPKRHRKARLKYWRGLYRSLFSGEAGEQVDAAMALLEGGYVSAEQLGSAAAKSAGGGRIVVWTTPSFEDRLFLWFVFDALTGEGVASDQIATAEPRVTLSEQANGSTRYTSLRDLEADELVVGFDDRFYPELVYVEAGANLWETFASVSPRQFAISIPHTAKFFPEFPVFAEDYGRLFPVAEGGRARRLALSELDRDLLSQLDGGEAKTGGGVIGDTLADDYRFLDDLVLLARLRAWSLCDEGAPYVDAQAQEGQEDVFEQFTYRLTERGAELLETGFEPGRKLPIFFVGDARLYAGKKPWVRVVDGDYWWFERFDADS